MNRTGGLATVHHAQVMSQGHVPMSRVGSPRVAR